MDQIIPESNGEKEEQHSLMLWECIRFRKEQLVFLWHSPLLAGDLLMLLEEDPGNSKDGELHWGQRLVALTLASSGGSSSLFPKILIPPHRMGISIKR